MGFSITTRLSILAIMLVCALLRFAHVHQVRERRRPGTSPTLAIANEIFVISLPRRLDRRRTIIKLGRFMHLNFDIVNATNADHPDIQRIMRRVRRERQKEAAMDGSSKGAFREPMGPQDLLPYGSDFWTIDASHPLSSDLVDPLPPDDPLDPDADHPIPCTRGSPFYRPSRPLTKESKMTTLSPPMVACWNSHLQVIRRIAERPDYQVSIILEDDVDFEWDIEERLKAMWADLPTDWDVVMLGMYRPFVVPED